MLFAHTSKDGVFTPPPPLFAHMWLTLASLVQALKDENEGLVKQLKAINGHNPNTRVSSSPSSTTFIYGLLDLLLILQPNCIINHIASPSFRLEPHYFTYESSTVLFADISGYTALAQALGASGAAGTELLSKSLDDFFGKSARLFKDDLMRCENEKRAAARPSATTSLLTLAHRDCDFEHLRAWWGRGEVLRGCCVVFVQPSPRGWAQPRPGCHRGVRADGGEVRPRAQG